ncbi:hypothetical protein NLJ89_g10627 [Agrocybe chaxingu]|uniref:Uncharacterized protein n=1 Tax=Agrocybe chaxingu TaxID=84603 RepID=A0A9W8JQW6_9AGAR|nr:hypothetical protein NLJ89_g10627 [Agrocybe chaxingu]
MPSRNLPTPNHHDRQSSPARSASPTVPAQPILRLPPANQVLPKRHFAGCCYAGFGLLPLPRLFRLWLPERCCTSIASWAASVIPAVLPLLLAPLDDEKGSLNASELVEVDTGAGMDLLDLPPRAEMGREAGLLAAAATDVNWDQYVFSEGFDRDCDKQSKRRSSSSSGSSLYEHLKLWDSDDASSLTPVDSSGHGVSKLEAYLYYHGIRGNRKSGPKLIYRTSTDTFSPPFGPSQDLRKMQLLTVHGHGKLGQNNLWAVIRDKVHNLLKA